MRGAFAAMASRLGERRPARYVVQAMAPTGVATRLRHGGGPAVRPGRLLRARRRRNRPARRLVLRRPAADRRRPRRPGASGARRAAAARPRRQRRRSTSRALEDLLARLARLADDLPEVAALELNPVVVAPAGAAVLAARTRLARPAMRADRAARALRG